VSVERTCREVLGEDIGYFLFKISPDGGIQRRLRYETYSHSDIRALGPYLSVSSCDEINAACDRFLASRGKKTGRDYAKHINKKHYDI
jgi:hypothetical protein